MTENKKNTPTVSVLIPVYNVEKYIRQCLDSIIAQSYQDFEVVMIDDASPDNCPAICDEYAGRYDNFHAIHLERNGGLLHARDVAISNAEGEYILWVDPDDYIGPDRIKNLIITALEHNADAVNCDMTFVYEQTGKTRVERSIIAEGVYTGAELEELKTRMMSIDRKSMCRTIANSMVTKLWRRTLLENAIGRFRSSIRMGEDSIRTYYAMMQAKVFCVTHDASYYYRQFPAQMSRERYHSAYFENSKCIYMTLREAFPDAAYKHEIDENLSLIAVSAVLNEANNPNRKERRKVLENIIHDKDIMAANTDISVGNLNVFYRIIAKLIRKGRIDILLFIIKAYSLTSLGS